MRDDGSAQPLNNIQKIQVKNNLMKNNNLERQKLDDEEMALKNGKTFAQKAKFFNLGLPIIFFIFTTGAFALSFEHPASQKNREADMNNPNVYQSIDELDDRKIDHLYDEIKQKEGFNPGKFCKFKIQLFLNKKI